MGHHSAAKRGTQDQGFNQVRFHLHRPVILRDCADVFVVLEGEVSLLISFCPITHRVQGYPSRWGLSTGPSGGKSLANWFEAIHSDIVKYVHRLLHILIISHPVRVWGIHDPKNVCIRSIAGNLHNLLTYDIGSSHVNDQRNVKAPARSIGEWVSVAEHLRHRILN